MLSRLPFALLMLAPLALAQNQDGTLRLLVADPARLPVVTAVELLSNSSDFHRTYTTGSDGILTIRHLPYGLYRVGIAQQGFAPFSELIEIRSPIPVEQSITLNVASLDTALLVSEHATLIDPHSPTSANRIGAAAILESSPNQPGRSIISLIDAEPGWLLEANAVLHPRGSEYQTQYVIDGMPLTDNRSPAFAPEIDPADVQSMNVLTAGFPAEYGRKLGGVIEVTTARDVRPGWHATVDASGGSFATAAGDASLQYGWGANTMSLSANAARTDRYLDPPVLENYTNQGTAGGASARYERDLSAADRISLTARHDQSRFLVPDEQLQQQAGQRQDRTSGETAGQFSWQHVFSPRWLASVQASSRDLSAALWSNTLSTPILAFQDRGFREAYLKAAVSAHLGRHELKFGADSDFASIRESFSYRITQRSTFDPDTPRRFSFADRRQDREQAAFVQDLIRLGDFTASLGLRWDHYRLLTADHALSPRAAASWYWRAANLVVHAAYDRVFETPAIENLLLAGSPAVAALNDTVLRLPVRPSTGNFYETGISKALAAHLRLDVNLYRRDARNFADDDLLLNTGVSFPIAFRKAEIQGVETRLELPRWGRLSGFLSWSNMRGTGWLPVTGGLFLGDEAAAQLAATDRFPISQDQRNTLHGRIRAQLHPRLWAALGAGYGSGLPVEFDGTPEDALAQYGAAIVSRVNFDRGRVRPAFSLDASLGADLWKADSRTLRLQADAANLSNRLNVINFAGLFSGTAVAAPRSVSIRLSAAF